MTSATRAEVRTDESSFISSTANQRVLAAKRGYDLWVSKQGKQGGTHSVEASQRTAIA